MSKKNKCVGLDCEMCGNTKCPNEEKEKIINGIDVSECPLFDKKTGCYHTFNGECVKDSCALYKWLLEYKFLKQELDIKEKMLDKFMIGSGEILEKLQKENEELKNTPRLELDTSYIREKELECIKYKQALEEIRNLLLQIDENNWLHTGKHIYLDDRCVNELKQRILATINEVLKCR